MTSACRPLTAWRHLAALLCAVALFVPGPAGAQPCTTCARTSLGLAPRSYPAGDAPVAAAAGDLDGDGRADLVVANDPPLAGQVRVLLGGPNGFVLAGTYAQSPVPRGVAIADFDTDGLPDVVVALSDGGRDGAGPAQHRWRQPEPGSSRLAERRLNTSAVVVGDFDGNGTPDVAASQRGLEPGLRVPWGRQRRPGQRPHHARRRRAPRALVAGFFDAGGILDLAVASASEDRVRVVLGREGGNGKGDGTFTAGPVLDVNPPGATSRRASPRRTSSRTAISTS